MDLPHFSSYTDIKRRYFQKQIKSKTWLEYVVTTDWFKYNSWWAELKLQSTTTQPFITLYTQWAEEVMFFVTHNTTMKTAAMWDVSTGYAHFNCINFHVNVSKCLYKNVKCQSMPDAFFNEEQQTKHTKAGLWERGEAISCDRYLWNPF